MKKAGRRFMAICTAAAMFVSVMSSFTALAETNAVKTYFDMTMENWSKASDRLNSDGTNISATLGGTTDGAWDYYADEVTEELLTDAQRNSKVWKLTKTPETASARSRIRFDVAENGFEKTVLWTEISFKYEGSFTPMGWEYKMGIAPVFIDKDGNIRKFARNFYDDPTQGGVISPAPLKLGKWYTLSVAMDFPNAPVGDGGPLYVWLNGEKIFSGTDYNSNFRVENADGTSASAFDYMDFSICRPENMTAMVSIDSFKVYTTSALDEHPAKEFENLSITDSTTDDEFSVSGNIIYAAAAAKVSDVKSAFLFPENTSVTFTKGNQVLSDADAVMGAKVMVNSANGTGFKEYIVKSTAQAVTDTYYDMNMDNWSSASDKKNADGTSVSGFSWAASLSPKSESVETNKILGGKSWVICDDTSSTGNYSRARYNANIPSTFPADKVLWTEITLKYEGQIAPLGWEYDMARSPIHIAADGTIYRFGRWAYNSTENDQPYESGTPLEYKLNPGRWYTIAVALDFTADTDGTGAPLYVWVNGTQIAAGTDKVSELCSSGSFKYVDLWIDQVTNGNATVSIDSFKCYTTKTVSDLTQSEFRSIDITDGDLTDKITLSDNKIIAPRPITAAEIIKAFICPAGCRILIAKEGSPLNSSENADGALLYCINDDGGYKIYEINPEGADVLCTYFDMNMDNWPRVSYKLNSDGSSVSGFDWANIYAPESEKLASDINMGGKSWVITEDAQSTGNRARARFNSGIPQQFGSAGVLWTEMSLKFEGQFTALGWEHDMAVSPVYVDSEGNLRKFVQWAYDGNESLGEYINPDFKLELGKWYHIVVALDFAGAPSGEGAPLYVWVNGEKIADGAKGNENIKADSGFNYYDLWIAKPDAGSSEVWIDNFKSYMTYNIDSHAEEEFKGIEIADENTDDQISVEGDIISAPDDTTVSEIKAAFNFPENTSSIFTWNSVLLSDTDNVSDATLFIKNDKTIGFKYYSINSYKFTPKTYFNMNIDNWKNADDMINADGTAVSGASGEGFSWISEPKNREVVNDAARKTKALKISVDSTADALLRLNLADKSFEKNVLWTEFSFKFDGGFTPFGYNFAKGTAPFYIDENGYMRMFSSPGTSDENAAYVNKSYKLNIGEWYHVAYALNFTGAGAGNGARAYIRVNGASLADGISATADFGLAEITEDGEGNISASKAENFGKIEFFAGKTSKDSVSISLDNIKLYTTLTVDNHAKEEFEAVTLTDKNSADYISVFGDKISAPQGTLVSQIKNAFGTDGTISILYEGTELENSDFADGAVVYVNSLNGIGFKKYIVSANIPEKDIKPTLFYDIDFDAASDNPDNWANRANIDRKIGYLSDKSTLGKNDVALSLADGESDGKALSIVDSGNNGLWYIGDCDGYVLPENAYNGNSIRYEIAFRYENGIIPAYMKAKDSVFEIEGDGKLYVGSSKIFAADLAAGQWYHLAVAIDNTEGSSKIYAWLNGEEKVSGAEIAEFVADSPGFGVNFNGNIGEGIIIDDIKLFVTPKNVHSGLAIFDTAKTIDSQEQYMEIPYFNDTGAAINSTFVLSANDENGVVRGVIKSEGKSLKVGYGKIKIKLSDIKNESVFYKLFIWDSINTMKPIAASITAETTKEAAVSNYAVNPILPSYEYIPDGEPYVFDGRVYLYGSHDRYNSDTWCDKYYIGWSAPIDNLSDWRCEGEIFNREDDPNYTGGDMRLHAPDVAKGTDGKYYLYYSINGSNAIGVAVSDTPAGHYKYHGRVAYPDGTAIGNREGDPLPFDPAVFVDSDGRVYLYMGYVPGKEDYDKYVSLGRKVQGAFCVELESDMKTIKSSDAVNVAPGRHNAVGTGFEGYGFFEAASMRCINGKYYFIYSTPGNGSPLCYAIGDTPVGPFTFGGRIVDNTDIGYKGNTVQKGIYGNNHGSIACINGQYYIFYHRQTRSGCARQACAEKIYINPDGSIDQVCMTSLGLGGEALPASGTYSASIACNIISSTARYAQDKPDGDITAKGYLSNIAGGDVVGFKYFNFDNNERIGISVKSLYGGTIYVYNDEDMTIPAGKIEILPKLDATEYNADINFANGIRPLYLKYEGQGDIELYNISFK